MEREEVVNVAWFGRVGGGVGIGLDLKCDL